MQQGHRVELMSMPPQHTSLQGAVPLRVSRVLVFRLSGWNWLTNTYLVVGKGLEG